MDAGGRVRAIVARAALPVAAAIVIGWSLREIGARLWLRTLDALPADIDPALATDVSLRVAQIRARIARGESTDAEREARAALALRPRDPELLLLLAEAAPSTVDRLRFALLAAREAPYAVEPAEFAFATAFAAVEARAPRAAGARETAARLSAARVTEGVAEASAEADRLDREMRAFLDQALSTYAATSPTARGMFFLGDSLARANRLAAELGSP